MWTQFRLVIHEQFDLDQNCLTKILYILGDDALIGKGSFMQTKY